MRYSPQTLQKLNEGGIGVIPTDTLYGLVARALDEKAVERVYQVRGRRPDKPCIILIADVSDLEKFGVLLDQATKQLINRLWPGPVSIVLPCTRPEFSYLHRGTKTLAFRLPADEELQTFLRQTGPLIAPSANSEGQSPAATIEKARAYFDDAVDFYIDAGPRSTNPSTVLTIENGKVRVVRQGTAIIPAELV